MPILYLVGVPILMFFLMFGMNALYTLHVDNLRAEATAQAQRELDAARAEQDRRWCALLEPLNRAYSSAEPATDLGRQVADAVRQIARAFGCREE
jgi:hypothetical protein